MKLLSRFIGISCPFVMVLLALTLDSTCAQAQNRFLHFDGANDMVQVPGTPALNPSNFTVECLVNASTIGEWDVMVSRMTDGSWTQGYGLYFRSTGRVGWSVNWSNATESTTILSTGTWYHVAGTYDGSTMRIYVNGVLENSRAYSSYSPDPGTLSLGSDGAYFLLNGFLDEVRVWNVVRSEAEINANKNSSLTGSEPGLVAYYQFDQGLCGGNNPSETALFDITSNDNDGNLQNFALNGCTSNWLCPSAPACPPVADNGTGGGGSTPTVPTLSEWSLIILGLSFLCFGAIMIRRRRSIGVSVS